MSEANGRARTAGRGLGPFLLLAVLLAGCADVGPAVPPELEAMRQRAAAEPYPDLREVPPRPRLGYSIEQRRTIARTLAADRDNVAYEGRALRRETGLAPAPAPAATSPSTTAGTATDDGDLAEVPATVPEDPGRAYVERTLRGPGRKGELDDLVEWMESFDAGAAPPPAARTAAVDELVGPRTTAPPLPLALAFPGGGTVLDRTSLLRLRAAAPALREGRRRIVIEVAAPSPELGHERLRVVARELVALGVPAPLLELRPRAGGDFARVRWAEETATAGDRGS